MIRPLAKILSLFLLFYFHEGLGQNKTLSVDVSRIMNTVPEKLYGACIEDVNHEIYGGLYDQKIFGESFEEPVPPAPIQGWRSYGGNWQLLHDRLMVEDGPGFKLIADPVFPLNYQCRVSLKFGESETNAGILIGVQNPGMGADSFDGYEISLDPNRQMLVLGRHRHDWEPIKEIPVHFNPKNWTLLRADVKDSKITVFVDHEQTPILVFKDTSRPFGGGHFGLRTYNAHVSFKGLGFDLGEGMVRPTLRAAPSLAVSSAWDPVGTLAKGAFQIDTSDAYNGQRSQIVLNAADEPGQMVGIANKGLNRWGIAFQKGHKYEGSVYLKAIGPVPSVRVALQNSTGTLSYGSSMITGLGPSWKKFNFSMVADHTDSSGRFAILLPKKGKVKIDQVTLQSEPKDQFGGKPLRGDIASMMQAEGLNFLRYGGTMVNAPGYRWKKMLGSRDKRPPYKGHWYPYSTNGFGIEEFLQFCEVAGFEPAFAINIEESPKDAADMIAYLKGDTSTYWGRRRAVNGHPQPYKVRYIEIGNEEVIFNGDVAEQYAHYIERFNLLYQAMHQKDTTIKFIISAWWRPASANMRAVFQALENKASYWDLHTDADDPNAGIKVDSTLTQMQSLFGKWDPDSGLKCVIFEENGSHHDLARALGHATTLNAVRRHGDFVMTSCAANALQPLGQNDNGWDQGQIFFTPSKVWGMPPFYAQKMAAEAHQSLRVASFTDADLDFTATASSDKKHLVLHVINTQTTSVTTDLQLKYFQGLHDEFTAKILTGKLKAKNSEKDPQKIVPLCQSKSWKACAEKYTFQPHSYTILEFSR